MIAVCLILVTVQIYRDHTTVSFVISEVLDISRAWVISPMKSLNRALRLISICVISVLSFLSAVDELMHLKK